MSVSRRIIALAFSVSLATVFNTSVFATTHHSGATLGSFSVDANGAATYGIKIETPPGTGAAWPRLYR